MPDDSTVSVTNPKRTLAARERAIANSKIDHGAIYEHVAATKVQIFGKPEFSVCPQCDRQYRLFNNPHWKGDQSVCQACADENFAPTRAIMQRIEHAYAEKELQQIEGCRICGPFIALSGVPV
jgi:glutaredoxin